MSSLDPVSIEFWVASRAGTRGASIACSFPSPEGIGQLQDSTVRWLPPPVTERLQNTIATTSTHLPSYRPPRQSPSLTDRLTDRPQSPCTGRIEFDLPVHMHFYLPRGIAFARSVARHSLIATSHLAFSALLQGQHGQRCVGAPSSGTATPPDV